MKTQYLVALVAILLVVSVSGCIEGMEFPGFLGTWGTTQPTVEQSPDIIITKDMTIIPKPPILADNEFILLFTMKNQDEIQSISDVNVKLYDWGICEPIPGDFLPQQSSMFWVAKSGYYIGTFDEVVPRQEEVIEWAFKSPDNARIGNIETDCPIRWEIDYMFSARSQDDFTIISKERKRELDYAGETWQGTNQPQYVGIGPIKIYYDFKTPMPVQSKSSIQFSLKVLDKGSGIYPRIETGTMKLKVPESWVEGLDDEYKNNPCSGKLETVTPTGQIISEDYPIFILSQVCSGTISYDCPDNICRVTHPPGGGNPDFTYTCDGTSLCDEVCKVTSWGDCWLGENCCTQDPAKECKDITDPVICTEAGCDSNVYVCGDGNTDPDEECDDGNTNDGDGCSSTCTIEATCIDSDGDGYYVYDDVDCRIGDDCDDTSNAISPGATEICDDLVDNDCDELIDCDDSDCLGDLACPGVCGDGNVDEGEDCDDGANGDNCDGCLDDCTSHTNVCGDDYVCDTEECDDGNLIDGDGCSSTCTIELVVEEGYVIYENAFPINLIKRESPEIICRFEAPDLAGTGIPEKSYFLTVEIEDYIYRLTDEELIHIKPSV